MDRIKIKFKFTAFVKTKPKTVKKGTNVWQAIQYPLMGELIVSNSKIKKVTLEYCLRTLKNNEPEEEAKEAIELKEEIHKSWMNDKTNHEENKITDEDFFI